LFFFFNDTATTEIYTLSLHDALPIYLQHLGLDLAGPDRFFDRVFQSFDSLDRKSTRLNSSHANISYAVFCLKKHRTDGQGHVGRRMQQQRGLSDAACPPPQEILARDHAAPQCAAEFLDAFLFFFNDTAPTEIYTLSLHDALPISPRVSVRDSCPARRRSRSHPYRFRRGTAALRCNTSGACARIRPAHDPSTR